MVVTKDPTASLYYGYFDDFWPEFTLLAVDAATGQAVAKAHSVPISDQDDFADGLPEGGWDWAIRTAMHDRFSGTRPTMVSALKIMIRPDLRGAGLSARMLGALRDNAAKLGFTDLVAPVRPSGKRAERCRLRRAGRLGPPPRRSHCHADTTALRSPLRPTRAAARCTCGV